MAVGMNRYTVFLKAAELGSLTRAAQALHYTQSGVSHAIAALAQEVGTALFLRTGYGVTLTHAGQQLLPAIRQLENARLRLEQTISQLSSAVSGTLRLGTISNVSAGFRKSSPDLSGFIPRWKLHRETENTALCPSGSRMVRWIAAFSPHRWQLPFIFSP